MAKKKNEGGTATEEATVERRSEYSETGDLAALLGEERTFERIARNEVEQAEIDELDSESGDEDLDDELGDDADLDDDEDLDDEDLDDLDDEEEDLDDDDAEDADVDLDDEDDEVQGEEEGRQEEATAKAKTKGKLPELTPEQVQEVFRKYKHKLTVDGQELEVDYDRFQRMAQMEEASQRRMREAALERQGAKETLSKLGEKGLVALIDLKMAQGKSRQEAEQELIQQAIEVLVPMSKETPEQRAWRHRQAEIERKEAALQRKEDEAKRKAEEAADLRAQQEFATEARAAFQKVGLPETPAIVKRMASIMNACLKSTPPIAITCEEALQQVKAEREEGVKRVSDMSYEDLRREYPEIAKKLAKRNIERAHAKRKVRTTPSRRRRAPDRREEGRRVKSPGEFFGELQREAFGA